MNYTHVFFDCDSTLLNVETLDLLAERKGVGYRVRNLTEQSMNGELSIDEAMPLKMDLIAPHQDEIDALFEDVCMLITPGTVELLQELRNYGAKVYILTNNFREVIKPAATYLGFTDEFILASTMYQRDGAYAGIDKENPLGRDGGKPHMLKSVMKQVKDGRSVHIGDSVSDLACQGVANLFIGFGGVVSRRRVMEEAECFACDVDEVMVYLQKLS